MAKKKSSLTKIGVWAFIIGIILALVGGIIASLVGARGPAIITSVLIVLGIIVGFLNVTDKETSAYLMAAVSLVIVTTFGGQVLSNILYVGPYLSNVLVAILTFVIPAVIIVAIKVIYTIAQD